MNDILSSKIDRAIALTAIAHQGQFRKPDNKIPYVAHVYHVGLILQKADFGEKTIIAGILHDIIEDTPTKIEEIENEFGEGVAKLVILATNPKGLSKADEVKHQIEVFKTAPQELLAIKAADILHNIYSRVAEFDKWDEPKELQEKVIENYQSRLDALKSVWNHQLIQEIEKYLSLYKDRVASE